MKYYSVTETAERWGISTRRVLKLAKEGRIDGAYQISSRWLIPASAVKPHDERRKASVSEHKDDAYRFPLFFYSITPDNYDDNDFTEEERELMDAVLHYERFELSECIRMLERMMSETTNQYLKISILYMLVYAYHDNRNFDKAVQSLHKLKLAIIQADHQEELSIIFQEANALFDGSDSFAESFSLDFTYSYSKEFLIYCSVTGVLVDAINLLSEAPGTNLISDEIICQSLEIQGYFYVAIFTHFYLSILYSFKSENELTQLHLKAAFASAEKYRLYSSFLYVLANSPNYDEIIKAYASEENVETLLAITKNHKETHSDFLRYIGKSTFNLNLTSENYKYIAYCIKSFTIERMAQEEGATLYNVKKNLKKLYDKFKVNSRKELLSKIYNKGL